MSFQPAAAVQRAIFRVLPAMVRKEVARTRPLAVGQYALQLFGGETLLLDRTEKSTMLRKLFWQGTDGHEPWSLRTFYHFSRQAGTILDIGACFGLYGLVAACTNSRATVHCFEPFPANVELARHLAGLNELRNLTVHQLALSDAAGQAHFHVPSATSGKLPDIGSLVNRFGEGGRFSDKSVQAIEVNCVTLDGFCDSAGFDQVDLIKLDVEEAELRVLSGGLLTIERWRPDILCEIIFDNPDLPQIEQLLQRQGYRFFSITPTGLYENPTLTAPVQQDDDIRLSKKRGGYTDMLLTAKSDAELRARFAGGSWGLAADRPRMAS